MREEVVGQATNYNTTTYYETGIQHQRCVIFIANASRCEQSSRGAASTTRRPTTTRKQSTSTINVAPTELVCSTGIVSIHMTLRCSLDYSPCQVRILICHRNPAPAVRHIYSKRIPVRTELQRSGIYSPLLLVARPTISHRLTAFRNARGGSWSGDQLQHDDLLRNRDPAPAVRHIYRKRVPV